MGSENTIKLTFEQRFMTVEHDNSKDKFTFKNQKLIDFISKKSSRSAVKIMF